MSYDTVGGNNFKTVQYGFNADKQSVSPVKIMPPKHDDVSEKTPEKTPEKTTEKTPIEAVKKDTLLSKAKPSSEAKAIEHIAPIDVIKPNISEMPEISFVPKIWTRDLILYENKKPAISKTYYFNYKDKNFPGVVTDHTGKIYLYDRANGFHRPLKHLIRLGDDLSGYHAGFQEKSGKRQSKYFIDLGSLEILQAALRSSAGGKYTVSIKNDDSFMTNWMHATSDNDIEKFRYWNDNSVRLHPKANISLYPLKATLGASLVIVPTVLMSIAVANQGDLTPNDRELKPLSDNAQKALIGTVPALGGIGLGIIGATLYKNRSDNLLLGGNENLKTLEAEYTDTFVSKPR